MGRVTLRVHVRWQHLMSPLACALVLTGVLVGPNVPSGDAQPTGTHWLATWGASPEAAVAGTLSATGFDNETVRDIIFPSIGGNAVRVQFANTFGQEPLEIGKAAIGVDSEKGGLVPNENGPLSFGWSSAVLATSTPATKYQDLIWVVKADALVSSA